MQAEFAGFHLQGLFNQIIEAVKIGLAQGIHNVFLLSVVIMAVGTVAVFFLKEVPLRGRSNTREAAESAADGRQEAEAAWQL